MKMLMNSLSSLPRVSWPSIRQHYDALLTHIETDPQWRRHGLTLGAFFLLFEVAVWSGGSTGFFTAVFAGVSASLYAALVMLLVVFINAAEG
jgi:hypothetical protein